MKTQHRIILSSGGKIALCLILAAILGATGAILILTSKHTKLHSGDQTFTNETTVSPVQLTPSATPVPSSAISVPPHWLLYKSSDGLFSFMYPGTWTYAPATHAHWEAFFRNGEPAKYTADEGPRGNEALRFVLYGGTIEEWKASVDPGNPADVAGKQVYHNQYGTAVDVRIGKIEYGSYVILHMEFGPNSQQFVDPIVASVRSV